MLKTLIAMCRAGTAIAVLVVATQAALANPPTEECHRDIRKDNQAGGVVHDLGCTEDWCDQGMTDPCSPKSQTVLGVKLYGCACDSMILSQKCILMYKDSQGNSTAMHGGGQGGSAECRPLLCPRACVNNPNVANWVDIGDPNVPQHSDNCVCP